MEKKSLHLGVLLFGCGHHQAAWKMPNSSIERLGDITYHQSLAQLAEKGLLDIVFFADNQSFPGNNTESFPVSWFDPLINLTAISQVTKHVGLVPTVSSTFSNPYTVARQLLSLDHITGGRVGWNLVTSMTDLEAQNHSMEKLPPHEIRYKKAHEFAKVVNGLFETWQLDSFQPNREAGTILDTSMIHPINHKGDNFEVKGPMSTPGSPQGKPVALQAGASDYGVDLANTYAECVYSVSWNLAQARQFKEKLVAKESNRTQPLKIFPGLVTYVGKTREEAWAKKEALDDLLAVETGLNQLSFFTQQDCATWDLNEKVPSLPPLEEFTGPKGRYQTILEIIQDKNPTVKELLGYLSAGGGHFTSIGKPEDIVDDMERWLEAGVADGFNLMPPTLPGSLDDFVTLVVPELQKRGLFRKAYQDETLRQRLGLA